MCYIFLRYIQLCEHMYSCGWVDGTILNSASGSGVRSCRTGPLAFRTNEKEVAAALMTVRGEVWNWAWSRLLDPVPLEHWQYSLYRGAFVTRRWLILSLSSSRNCMANPRKDCMSRMFRGSDHSWMADTFDGSILRPVGDMMNPQATKW